MHEGISKPTMHERISFFIKKQNKRASKIRLAAILYAKQGAAVGNTNQTAVYLREFSNGHVHKINTTLEL